MSRTVRTLASRSSTVRRAMMPASGAAPVWFAKGVDRGDKVGGTGTGVAGPGRAGPSDRFLASASIFARSAACGGATLPEAAAPGAGGGDGERAALDEATSDGPGTGAGAFAAPAGGRAGDVFDAPASRRSPRRSASALSSAR